MSLKIHDFDGIPFVATPYRTGAYIREDVFRRQFTIRCEGEIKYVQDDPRLGTYWSSRTLVLGQCGLIEEAIALASIHASQREFDLSDDPDALAFSPELFIVRDARNSLVLSGRCWGSAVRWSAPVTSDSEAACISKEADDLYREASYEAGWDNFGTAQGLRLRARVIEGRLVDRFWRTHTRAALLAVNA